LSENNETIKDVNFVEKSSAFKSLIRRICFISFGICAFYNPLERFNLYRIGFGIVVGLFFGWLFKKFLRGFLGIFNPKFKKEKGKQVIRNAVDNGMLFLAPFAIMLLLATFYLKWSMTSSFISAGIMAVGTSSAIEIAKLKGEQQIKNTIATSGVSFAFSFIWTLSYQFLVKAPALIEGGVNIIRSIISGGGGGIL
jgi:glycosyltransferase involved in cell wall biosynthesis